MSGLMEPPTQPLRKPAFSLVTPSASPPPRQAVTKAGLSTGPSPDKRSRVSATPKPSQASSSASSSARPTEEPIDYDKERKASASRLLDVWSQLAERYTRRLDEDDIVDIVTGKIVKDNGVLRKAKMMRFGDTHASGKSGEDEAEESDEEDEQEGKDGRPGDEDDEDELDAFVDADNERDDDEEPEVLEIHSRVEAVPPVTPQNPLDAADLKEFMETERLRRSVLGSEPEDDPDAYLSEAESTDQEETTLPNQQAGDSDSEDELNFNFEEEVIPPELEAEASEVEDSDDEIEIIECPPLKPVKQAPKRSPPAAVQLQTPPLSTTSAQPPFATPTEELLVSPEPDAWSPEIPVSDAIQDSLLKTRKIHAKPKQQSTPREKSKKHEVPASPKLVAEVVITRRTPFSVQPSSIPRLSVPALRTTTSTPAPAPIPPPTAAKRATAKSKVDHKKPKSSALPSAKPTGPTKSDSLPKSVVPANILPPARVSKALKKTKPSAQTPPSSPPPSEHQIVEVCSTDIDNSSRTAAPASPRKRKRSLDLAVPTPSQAPTRPFPVEPLASSSKVQLEHMGESQRSSSDNESPVRCKPRFFHRAHVTDVYSIQPRTRERQFNSAHLASVDPNHALVPLHTMTMNRTLIPILDVKRLHRTERTTINSYLCILIRRHRICTQCHLLNLIPIINNPTSLARLPQWRIHKLLSILFLKS